MSSQITTLSSRFALFFVFLILSFSCAHTLTHSHTLSLSANTSLTLCTSPRRPVSLSRMANDDLLVRNAIERLGVNASIEWTRQCIAFHRTLDAANSTTASEQDIAQFAWEMYLLADFRILDPKPMLPSSIATPHKQRLFKDVGDEGSTGGGGVVLQILEVQDIGISALKMLEACEAVGVAGDQPGGFLVEKTLPKGMISLDVTDGVRKMSAILMEPIAGIAMEMKLGAKVQQQAQGDFKGLRQYASWLYSQSLTDVFRSEFGMPRFDMGCCSCSEAIPLFWEVKLPP